MRRAYSVLYRCLDPGPCVTYNLDTMLLDYIAAALKSAQYEKLDDGKYCGTIRTCPGVIAFAATLYECQEELRSVLEDWLIVKLRHNDPLPVLAGINLNRRGRAKATARA